MYCLRLLIDVVREMHVYYITLLVLCIYNILISGCMSELHEVVLQVDLQL